MPATAELRQQRRGWYLYGWASHTFPTIVTTVFMSRYLTSVAEHAVGKQGRVHVAGLPIGFYEISDAGTSWLGPLVFGVAYQNTGNYRSALASLVVFFVIGFVLLALVPVRRAIEAAGNVAPAKV